MKVATIEKIEEIKPHLNADNLELAKIKGWQVCVKKNEFKKDDLCIYICTDSILEDKPPYDFLRNRNFRIKTIKLRGEISCGLAFPLSLLKTFGHDVIVLDDPVEGTDVGKYVYAKHYEKPVPEQLAGKVVGSLPPFLWKTDEDNIKNNPGVIDELNGKPYYITTKVDGSSGTFFIYNGEFGVCSRNYQLHFAENNSFWKIAKKYDVENKIKAYFGDKNICIQGEVYGPGIQSNSTGQTEISLKIFNLFDIDTQKYLNYADLKDFCEKSNLSMVSIVESGESFNKTITDLQNIANNLKYENGNLAEGIVIRPKNETYSSVLKGRLTGKIISEPYELKYND